MSTIYFDHNATTTIDQRVHDAVCALPLAPYNPSSVHTPGRTAKHLLEAARLQVKEALDIPETYNVVFTASGTEANNIAIRAFHGHHKLASVIEHPSILNPVGEALLEVDADGVIRLDVLEHYLQIANQNTPVLVSVMLINNETGVIQPICKIVEIAKRYGAFIHTDAVQAVGKIPVSIRELGVDLLTFSSHKIGGPQGVGVLIINKSLPITATLIQGGGQEYRIRAGTQNIPGIYGFGIACTLLQERIHKHAEVQKLRDHLESHLSTSYPEAIIVGAKAKRSPNTSSIIMPGIPAETQVIHFDLHGIAISAGAACSSGKVEWPYVHMAMGYTQADAQCAGRVSLGLDNTISEINRFVEVWGQLYKRPLSVSNL